MKLAPPQTNLKPAFPEPIWMDMFGARLMQLQPSMNAVRAAGCASTAWPERCDLDPGEAAEIFALELPPDRGAPPQ